MTKEEAFESWAPPSSVWSQWVKPVLFASVEHDPLYLGLLPEEWDMAWAPGCEERNALVLDLPGAQGVAMGLALAARGYRPIPLYNSVPGPTSVTTAVGMSALTSLVDVQPIIRMLWHGADTLRQLNLPADAPPAFLLDATRRGEGQYCAPGRFDNRSIAFTTDFPSANFLLAHGIRRAIVGQSGSDEPQPDLAHTLRRWQEGGLSIALKRIDSPRAAVTIEVDKPSGFGLLCQRVLQAFGFRRNALGGFGGFIPEPSSG